MPVETSIDDVQGKIGLNSLANRLKKWIKYIAFLLGTVFTFVQLSGAPLDKITNTIDNTDLIKIGLVIYFFGWLYGATHDTEIQARGYCIDPKRGDLGLEEIGGIVVFVIVFFALFYAHDKPVLFQAMLLAFICTNMYTWRVIFSRTIPMIEAAYAKFSTGRNPDLFALARLHVVVNYMNGRWQKGRFFSLIFLCILQLILALLVEYGVTAQIGRGIVISGVPLPTLLSYSPGIAFIIYVLIAEVWMKMYRIRVFADLDNLEFFENHFRLEQRRGVALPAVDTGGVFARAGHSHPNYRYSGLFDWLVDPG